MNWMGSSRTLADRGSFPSDEALMTLFYLALLNISRRDHAYLVVNDWKAAINRFPIDFEERIPQL